MATDPVETYRVLLASPDPVLAAAVLALRDRPSFEPVDALPADVALLSLSSAGGLDGLRRRVEEAPEVPVVVVIPAPAADLAEAALANGAADAVGPDPDLLLRSIRYVVERRRLRRALRRQSEETVRLQQALVELSRSDPGDEAAALLRHVRISAHTLGVDRVSVWLFNADHSELVCSVLYRREKDAVESGATLQARDYPRYFAVMEESRVVAAENARTDPRTSEFTDGYLVPHGIVSMMDVPVRLRGRLVGVVCHETIGTSRPWTFEQQGFASSIADGVALVLGAAQHRRTEQALQQERTLASAVLDSTATLVAVLDARGCIVRVNRAFSHVMGYPASEVAGRPFGELLFMPTDLEVVRHVLATPPPEEGVVQHEHPWTTKQGTRPLIAWTLAALRAKDGPVRNLVVTGVDITERKALEEQLIHDAFHDSLTGLPNRSLFLDRLGQCIRQARRRPDRRFAVLFLDLDRFKIINDSLGHLAGDQLLVEAARRLEAVVRPGDTVARFGGDEFTVLLDDVRVEADAIQIADRIQKQLGAVLRLDGHEVATSVSIGIAMGGAEYTRAEEVLRDADLAMYRAKGRGGATHDIFDRSLHAGALTRLRIEAELRHAIERNEIVCYYQPILSLPGAAIAGFEALARWNSPSRGLVPPSEFIRLAEDAGLIIALDRFVLRKACTQLKRWRDRFPQLRPLSMSVNLSGRQFVQRDLAEHVRDVIRESGLEPGCVSLEITESVLLDGATAVAEALQALHDAGAKISLDDFGTGYSSLSYLHRFPIDILKIDRSFVSSMRPNGEGEDIVRTILALAQGLDLQVVAEGVETADQAEALKRLRCDYAQGYLYSRPVTAENAETLLEKETGLNAVRS
jgi:diguanylate cyclase (GGDEF)-like protein/PAS domain S-box-containing protein